MITYKLTKNEYQEIKDIIHEMKNNKYFHITDDVWAIYTDNYTLVSVRAKDGSWKWESEWYKNTPDDYKQHLYQIGSIYDMTDKLEFLLDHRITTKR